MKRITILLFLCFLGITMTSAQQKTFKGTWLYEKGEKSGTIQLDLYQKSVENGFDMDGALCYGTFAFSDGSYYSIEEVKVEGNNASLQKVFDTEMGEYKMQMTYDPINLLNSTQMGRTVYQKNFYLKSQIYKTRKQVLKVPLLMKLMMKHPLLSIGLVSQAQ